MKNYVQAHPGRSMYGFSIDSDRPGYLKLCFLNKSTKDGGVIQTWVSAALYVATSFITQADVISPSKSCQELINSASPKFPESPSSAMPSKRNIRPVSPRWVVVARHQEFELGKHHCRWVAGHLVVLVVGRQLWAG